MYLTPAVANVARRTEVQSVEVDVPEDAIPDLPNVASLSEFKEVVISYITGLIVKKMKEKMTCLPLLTGINIWWCPSFFSSLIEVVSRNHQQAVCIPNQREKLPHGRGITAAIVNQVLAESTEKDLFPQLYSHMLDTCRSKPYPCSGKDGILMVLQSQIYSLCKKRNQNGQSGLTHRQLSKIIHLHGE